MNRLTYLRETFKKNIIDNLEYPDIEFVLLDYNSRDGMEDWVREHLLQYIETGVLKYYKTVEPEYFYLSHSKNMALKLATGDIVCMVDADNFSGEHYAAWVDRIISANGKDTIITTLEANRIPYRDQGGKLAFHKDLFRSVNGFDESLVGYGMEDVDLVNRLEKSGGRRFFIEDDKYLQYIGHSNEERLENHQLTNDIAGIYVQLKDLKKVGNRVMFLLKDKSCLDITFEYDESLKSNTILSYAGWVLRKEGHITASYEYTEDGLSFTYSTNSVMTYKDPDMSMLHYYNAGEKILLKQISRDHDLYNALVMAYTECWNRYSYRENDKGYKTINSEGWGKGTVYANFNRTKPIFV